MSWFFGADPDTNSSWDSVSLDSSQPEVEEKFSSGEVERLTRALLLVRESHETERHRTAQVEAERDALRRECENNEAQWRHDRALQQEQILRLSRENQELLWHAKEASLRRKATEDQSGVSALRAALEEAVEEAQSRKEKERELWQSLAIAKILLRQDDKSLLGKAFGRLRLNTLDGERQARREEELGNLRRELSDRSTALAAMEGKHKAALDELGALREAQQARERQVQEKEAEQKRKSAELVARCEGLVEKERISCRLLEDASSKIGGLEEELRAAHEQEVALRQGLESLKASAELEMAQAHQRMTELASQKEAVEAQLADQRRAAAAHSEQLSEASSSLQDEQRQVNTLRLDLQSEADRAQRAETSLAALQLQLKAQGDKYAEEAKRSTVTLKTLRSKCDELEKQLAASKAEAKAAQSTNEALVASVEQLRTQETSSTTARNSLAAEKAELEKAFEELHEGVQNAQKKLQGEASKGQELQRRLDAAEANAQELTGRATQLQDKIQTLEHALAVEAEEKQRLDLRLQESLQDLEVSRSQLSEVETRSEDLEGYRQLAEELKGTAKDLEQALEEAKETANKAARQAKANDEAKCAAERSLGEWKARLEAELSAKVQANEQLSVRLREREEALDRAEKECQQASEQLKKHREDQEIAAEKLRRAEDRVMEVERQREQFEKQLQRVRHAKANGLSSRRNASTDYSTVSSIELLDLLERDSTSGHVATSGHVTTYDHVVRTGDRPPSALRDKKVCASRSSLYRHRACSSSARRCASSSSSSFTYSYTRFDRRHPSMACMSSCAQEEEEVPLGSSLQEGREDGSKLLVYLIHVLGLPARRRLLEGRAPVDDVT
eukprot:scaffold1390_cov249-Pinguiococcus_pyrenoidosus.AAC.20